MEGRISGKTKLYALIGTPVGHSGSPAMYNYSFATKGIDSVYVAFDVDVEHTKDAIAAVKTFAMGGMNVTMPCKVEVVKYMDELSDAARIIGAVNTIVNQEGKLIGHNTDGVGFVSNLKDQGVAVRDKKITICGAGGAATAIIVQCALDGAKEIAIFKRNDNKFNETVALAKNLEKEISGVVVNVFDVADMDKMKEEMATSDIFVNGTVVGMKPMDDESVVKDITAFHKDLVVCDVVYNPIETKLLKEAAAAGCKTVGGKGMLLWQGAYAFELYTGYQMPIEEVKAKFFS